MKNRGTTFITPTQLDGILDELAETAEYNAMLQARVATTQSLRAALPPKHQHLLLQLADQYECNNSWHIAQIAAATTEATLRLNPRYVELRSWMDALTGKDAEREIETNQWAHDNPEACMANVYELSALEGDLREHRETARRMKCLATIA